MAETEERREPMTIIPGVSIGPVRLGSVAQALNGPKNVAGHVDVPAGISALVSSDGVLDIWIDNLRAMRTRVVVEGKVLAPDVSLDDLFRLLAPWEQIAEDENGLTFNCLLDLSFRVPAPPNADPIKIWVKRRSPR